MSAVIRLVPDPTAARRLALLRGQALVQAAEQLGGDVVATIQRCHVLAAAREAFDEVLAGGGGSVLCPRDSLDLEAYRARNDVSHEQIWARTRLLRRPDRLRRSALLEVRVAWRRVAAVNDFTACPLPDHTAPTAREQPIR